MGTVKIGLLNLKVFSISPNVSLRWLFPLSQQSGSGRFEKIDTILGLICTQSKFAYFNAS
jgi:hypothetical protein